MRGVGRKTANIMLGNAFGQPAIGVDTHVMRLSQRLGLSTQRDPDKIEADLTRVVPAKEQTHFCHLLQYHGRRVCMARKPQCPECVINDLCPYPDKTQPAAPRVGTPGLRPQAEVRVDDCDQASMLRPIFIAFSFLTFLSCTPRRCSPCPPPRDRLSPLTNEAIL